MARNGSGTYSLPAGNPVVTATTISSTWANNTLSDIATALTQSIAKDGQTTPTANLPMGTFKLTGMGAGSAATDSITLGQAQAQAMTWCGTAGGTANALTLTPSPAITAYAAGQRFSFKSSASPNSGATTVAISGLTTIAVQSNGAACVGGEIAANTWYEILVDASATSCQLSKIGYATVSQIGAAASGAVTASGLTQSTSRILGRTTAGTGAIEEITVGSGLSLSAGSLTSTATGASVRGSFKNLKLVASGLTNTSVVVTADEIALEDGSNGYYTAKTVSLTVNSTASGANGLDTGALAGSTWYSVWVIYNGATVAGLISASATSPTLPGGYTYYARVGWVRTDGTANKYLLQTLQYGRMAQYVVLASSNVPNMPQLASGAAGNTATPTWVAVATGNFVPSTASRLIGSLSGNGGVGMAAPNNQYGAINSTTNPPTVTTNSTGSYQMCPFEFVLESTNIYWASGGGSLWCFGWEDNI